MAHALHIIIIQMIIPIHRPSIYSSIQVNVNSCGCHYSRASPISLSVHMVHCMLLVHMLVWKQMLQSEVIKTSIEVVYDKSTS